VTSTDIGHLGQLAFIIGAACFVVGLHLMNSPATARSGNRLSALGMVIAVLAELVLVADAGVQPLNWAVILVGFVVGGGGGPPPARARGRA
jgi:NAD(P) transhydrogenase subunit beta